MASVIKAGNENEEKYFNPSALFMIIHIGEMNGWRHRGKDLNVFSKEVSEDLCDTLACTACEIEKSISPIKDHLDDICDDCFLKHLVERNQIEVIDEFIGFCQGEGFRIDFEN